MSIYEIADEMKQSKSSDGDMFKAIVSVEKISNSIKADVLSIKNETSEILKNTKNIIKQLSNSKITEKKKEKSVFDSLADKQSKTNIGDGIKSILLIPILIENQFWGLIRFDNCQSEYIWSNSDLDAFRSIGSIIGNFIKL